MPDCPIAAIDLQRALIKRTELFRAVQGVFGNGVDFILTPCVSAPPVAAEHDLAMPLVIDGVEVGDLRSEWTPYLSLFDLTGHPAIAMPAGLRECAAPLGVQLVAPWARTPHCSPPPALTSARARRAAGIVATGVAHVEGLAL